MTTYRVYEYSVLSVSGQEALDAAMHAVSQPLAAARAAVHATLTAVCRALCLAVLATPLIVADTYYPYVVGKALYSRMLIELAVGCWLLLALRSRTHWLRPSWALAALAAYVAVAAAAAIGGVSITRSLWSTYERMGGVIDLAHWAAYAVVVAAMFRHARHWRIMFIAQLAVSTVVAAWGTAEFGMHGGRIVSTLGNPVYVGGLMAMAATLALALAAESRRRLPVALCTMTFGLCLWALILSGTRAGLLALLVGVSIVGLAHIRGRRMVPVLAYGIMGLLVIAAVASPRLGLSDGISGRLHAYQAGLAAWAERPVLGYGPDAFVVAFDGHAPDGAELARGESFDRAHSAPVEALVTTGIVGLAAWGNLWATTGLALWRRRAVVGMAMGAAYLAFSLSQFDTAATMPVVALVWAMAIGERA